MIHITLEPDPNIEPGYQWLVLPNNQEGLALAQLLVPGEFVWKGEIRVPHTAEVDARIVELINELAHARFSAPALIQLTMEEAPELP